MAKKRTNSKKNQRQTGPASGSKNAKSPPISDASRPASRVSCPSDVENFEQQKALTKRKDPIQRAHQVFGNKASQFNIESLKNKEETRKPSNSYDAEFCVDLIPTSSVSSSRLDDTDVHIRQMIAEFRNDMGDETKKLKAIADINYMIGSTSSFLQRFTIRNKLYSYGFLSALAAHANSTPKNKLVDAEVNVFLLSESKDSRLIGVPDDKTSPIEILAKLMVKTNDKQWKKLVEVLDHIANSDDVESCTSLIKNRLSSKDSESQTESCLVSPPHTNETQKVSPKNRYSGFSEIPEESAVFCDSTSDDESKASYSSPTSPDAINTNNNLKKWATSTDLPSHTKFNVEDAFLHSASTFSSGFDEDGPVSPLLDSTLPAITEDVDSEEAETSEVSTGVDMSIPLQFSDKANIAFIDETTSTSSQSGSLGFSEVMTISFEMVETCEKKGEMIPPISKTAPPPPPMMRSCHPPTCANAPVLPPPPNSIPSNIPPVSSGAPPPPPPPTSIAPLSRNVPPPPPPPPPPSVPRSVPPPPPPLPLDMLKGAVAGLKSSTGGIPPPPPLPPASFLYNGNAPNAFSPSDTTSPVLSPGVVKSAVVYRKQKKTAFVRWPKLTVQMQDAGTVFNDTLCVDFNEEERSKMEEVFEEAPIKQLNRKIGGSVGRAFGKSLRAVTSSSDINTISARSPTNPQVLVSPKALTIEILIKKLKPLDFTELIEKMENNDTDGIKVDLMTTLNNNFPDKDELDPFLKIEYRTLTHASDQFCWHIARNKHLRLRIELFITKENVTAEIVKFQKQIESLQSGCKMARGEIVQILLRKGLQYGNYLNQGSMFAEASGFQFSYLLQLLQMKGKGQHSSVRLVDLIVAFCDLPTSQIEEIHSIMLVVRSLNLKDLEEAVGQVQRTIRKLEGQMRSSNVETLIAAYEPFMDETNEKLQNVQNGLCDLKAREMELQVYLCAGNMALQAIFETLEQGMKLVSDAVKQAASKAKVARASSMVSLPTTSSQRSLREGEVLTRNSMALKSRDLPVEELKKLFSHSTFGPQRAKRIPASPLTRTNVSPTRTIRRRSGETHKEPADKLNPPNDNPAMQLGIQAPTPSTPSPLEPPSVASLRREVLNLSSLVGSPV